MSERKPTDDHAESVSQMGVGSADNGCKSKPANAVSKLARLDDRAPDLPIDHSSVDGFSEEEALAETPLAGKGLAEAESRSMKAKKQCCLNCHEVLLPRCRYCGNCGQKVTDIRVTLWFLISDFFAQQFAVEGKLFRSVSTLMTRPGKLTTDFCSGRRARYFTPIQIYLLSGVIFFLMIDVFSSFDSLSPIQVDSTGFVEKFDYEGTRSINLGVRNAELTAEQFKGFVAATPKELPQYFAENDIKMNSIEMFFTQGFHQLLQPGGLKAFVMNYIGIFSQSILLMMPVFGFLVYGLYWRQSEGLVQAVVFSAHIHSFNYIVLVFISIVSLALNIDWMVRLLLIANFGYLIVASKNVFGGGYFAALAKSSIALFVYFIAITIFVILLFPVVVLTM